MINIKYAGKLEDSIGTRKNNWNKYVLNPTNISFSPNKHYTCNLSIQ